MRVEQNNFRDMFSVYLSGPPQTQHVFCVSPAARVAHTGLAGEEWLKAFPLQAFQYGDGGDVRIVLASGRVFIFPENPRHIVHQFFVCQRTVTAYLVRITRISTSSNSVNRADDRSSGNNRKERQRHNTGNTLYYE